ncbi:MAG: ABC transporter ATP-binding protein, partial [Planctomycetota bacterium]
AFGREDAVQARYESLNDDTAQAWRATVHHFSVFFALVDFALRATSVGLLWFGGSAVLRGEADPGVFVQFWLYFGMLTSPIKELGEKYNVLQAAFASTERIFLILDTPRFPPPVTNAFAPSARGAASIAFEDVVFGYREGEPVLNRVSFRAEKGSTVAIVGPTGAGKTTMLSLVSRLRDVTSGRVLVDDIDVRHWDVTALRRRVGVVAQDLFLFTGSVLDNVRLFDKTIAEDRVWTALEQVGAAEFVRALDGGLQAQVEERGGTFSQGQRQLLAFARALVTDPSILVLDEATASIDSASEARLQHALTVALRGRTALVVAHRLSTVRHSDAILVIADGRIAESGTHGQLLQRNGIYAGMLRACAESPS